MGPRTVIGPLNLDGHDAVPAGGLPVELRRRDRFLLVGLRERLPQVVPVRKLFLTAHQHQGDGTAVAADFRSGSDQRRAALGQWDYRD